MMIGDIDLVFGLMERDMLQSLDDYSLPARAYFCKFSIEIFSQLLLKEKMTW